MLAVGDQRRAVEAASAAEPNARGDGVADHADRSREAEREQVLGCQGVDDALDGEHAGSDRAGQDGEHDGEAGATLGALRAQQEGDAERDGGEGVAGVVDEVGEQRDAVGGDVDERLDGRCEGQDAKRGDDDPDPRP